MHELSVKRLLQSLGLPHLVPPQLLVAYVEAVMEMDPGQKEVCSACSILEVNVYVVPQGLEVDQEAQPLFYDINKVDQVQEEEVMEELQVEELEED